MTLRKLLPITALALSLGHAPGAAGADTALPAYYPEQFEAVGTLDGINHQQGFIVIDDRAISVDQSARVYTPTSQSQTLSQLKPGMTIAINREHRGAPVKEIWVIPKDR